MEKDQRLAGQTAVACSAILWSTAGLFIKLISWHPFIIAGARSLVAAVFLLVFRTVTQKKPLVEHKKQPLSPLLLIGGSINYALTMTLFIIANKLTSSANAILLQYTAPVWAALFGWLLLKERPFWQQWVSLAMVGAGMVLFFRDGLGGGTFLGDSLALISGITFGANSIFLRKAKDRSPVDILLWANVINILPAIPFFILYPPVFTMTNSLSILFLGIFQLGAASAFLSYGIKRITGVQAMLTATIEPVLNPFWVFLAIGEVPLRSTILGGIVIVAAVIFSSLAGKQAMKKAV